MQFGTMIIDELKSILPADWEGVLEELAISTMDESAPLRLTIVGAFSVGKSSLLNMLLGESFLPTAMEEATSLPTFIEYAQQTSMQLIMTDGGSETIDATHFAQVTTSAPQGAACTVLACSSPWLQGVTMIDLPGLGSVSATRAAYTQAQIRQADAVLYLLDPRGPTQKDLEILRSIRLWGKRVKVLVARWDQVETSVAGGEPAPSLGDWAVQIETGTGLKVRLEPVSCHGLGYEAVIDFIGRAREDLVQIRSLRLCAELKPILENALGTNLTAQQACAVETEAEQQQWHVELLKKKQALSDFKSSLYEKQQQEQKQQQDQAARIVSNSRTPLNQLLAQKVMALNDAKNWVEFEAQGSNLTNDALLQLAQDLSSLSAAYGQLELPQPQVLALNLRLPQPQEVEASEFVEMAQAMRLQQQLRAQQRAIEQAENKLALLPQDEAVNEMQVLHEMMAQRDQIMLQPLPLVERTIHTGNGAAIGRMLGDIADIGLIFVNPVTVGAKAAAIVGKGAKMAKIAVDTAKVAEKVGQGVKVIQLVKGGQEVMPTNPVMDKLRQLEMLSLGYWGEKLGAAMGGGPQQLIESDPEALAEQTQAISAIDGQIHALRRTLARNEDIANERMLTGHALDQSLREQSRLEGEIEHLQKLATDRQRVQQLQLQQQRQVQLHQYAQQAMQRWLRDFEQQADSMLDLLRIRIRDYWEDRVSALVEQRLKEVDELATQAKVGKSDKQIKLKKLLAEALAIDKALEVL